MHIFIVTGLLIIFCSFTHTTPANEKPYNADNQPRLSIKSYRSATPMDYVKAAGIGSLSPVIGLSAGIFTAELLTSNEKKAIVLGTALTMQAITNKRILSHYLARKATSDQSSLKPSDERRLWIISGAANLATSALLFICLLR